MQTRVLCTSVSTSEREWSVANSHPKVEVFEAESAGIGKIVE
jgi:hypothetical protein